MEKLDFYSAFNSTLNGCKFQFNNDFYNSVDDCVNKRKICSRLWNPYKVPPLHQNIVSMRAFMISEISGSEVSAFVIDDKCTIDIIKMILFTVYFEQVNVDSESKMLSKFYRVYCSCISTTRDFEFKKELIFCSKYEHVAESNECILSCSSNIKEQNIAQIENIIKLYDCVNIYIKSDKHLSQSIIKIISFNKKVKFNIIMDCCENSILLDRMIMIHSNVSVTNYIEDNENKYDICLCGTLDAGITIKNWDRVFVID